MKRDPDWLRRIVDETAFEVQAKPRHLLSPEVQEHLAKHGPIGGTRKIADLSRPCAHPRHDPPSHMVYEPGVWQHTCPSCGGSQTFTVTGATL